MFYIFFSIASRMWYNMQFAFLTGHKNRTWIPFLYIIRTIYRFFTFIFFLWQVIYVYIGCVKSTNHFILLMALNHSRHNFFHPLQAWSLPLKMYVMFILLNPESEGKYICTHLHFFFNTRKKSLKGFFSFRWMQQDLQIFIISNFLSAWNFHICGKLHHSTSKFGKSSIKGWTKKQAVQRGTISCQML